MCVSFLFLPLFTIVVFHSRSWPLAVYPLSRLFHFFCLFVLLIEIIDEYLCLIRSNHFLPLLSCTIYYLVNNPIMQSISNPRRIIFSYAAMQERPVNDAAPVQCPKQYRKRKKETKNSKTRSKKILSKIKANGYFTTSKN